MYIGVYGMSFDQFWKGDCWLARYYREIYIAKRKAENERDWYMGNYVYQALTTALSNAFRKKGTPAEHYLEKPFKIFPPTKEEIEEENRKEKEKIEAVYRNLLMKQRAEKAAKEQQDHAEA